MATQPIGVLLPARLETRFLPPGQAGAPWRLRVLVIPDEPWMNRHSPHVSKDELKRLEAMWRACKGDLNHPDTGASAFRQLAAEVGNGRAVWLARRFPPLPAANGATDWTAEQLIDWENATPILRSDDQGASPSRLFSLPTTIEIWMKRTGAHAQPERLEPPLTIDPNALDMAATLAQRGGLFWLESGELRSWFKEVGLEGTVTLPFSEEAQLQEIDFIAALGLGDANPADLFQSHCDAGVMSLLQFGTPTNTITGTPATDLGHDPDTWRPLVSGHSLEAESADDVVHAIGGAFGPVHGRAGKPRELNQALVRALWPALWGHGLKDIWNFHGDDDPASFVHQLGLWAADNLHPEGPLPPIRLGDQPYGLLPATALRQWRDDSGSPEARVEVTLRAWANRQQDTWATAALTKSGNVVGADTEKLLDLISRTPTSSHYGYRPFLPLQMMFLLAKALHDKDRSLAKLRDEWEGTTGIQLDDIFRARARRRYATWGWPQTLGLPLVEPLAMSEEESNLAERGVPLFYHWLQVLGELCHSVDRGVRWLILMGQESRRAYPPNSLLLRLLIHAALVADAELARWPASGPLLEPFFRADNWRTELDLLVASHQGLTFDAVLDDGFWSPGQLASPQLQLFRNLIHAWHTLIQRSKDKAGLGAIERAFRATLDTASHRIDPWITGIAWRRLNQLRQDGAGSVLGLYTWVDQPYSGKPGPTAGGLLHAPSDAQARTAVILRDKTIHDPHPQRWQMNLDSRLVRMAKQLADEVRAGSHIQEALGRVVEGIVADPKDIKHLRHTDKYRIRAEHDGRRVCNGQRVLQEDDATLRMLVHNDEARFKQLKTWQRVTDSYADLLVANAVFSVVNRSPERAGETMDAAAGLGLPPEMEVLRTPRRGRSVNTTVWLALPDVPAAHVPDPEDPDVSPATLVEPAFAAFVAQQLPQATWTWNVRRNEETVPVTLTHLGLTPAETFALTDDALQQLVLAQVPGGDVVHDQSPAWAQRRHARRLAAVFSGQPWQTPAVNVDLRARYAGARTAATRLVKDLRDAADDASRRLALKRATRWGIAPPAVTLDDPPEDEAARSSLVLVEQAKIARAMLQSRLRSAPVLGDQSSASDIARALLALAVPVGHMPVFGRAPRQALDMLSEDMPSPLTIRPTLDRDWLEIIAAVRPALARLESYQLEHPDGGAALQGWANHPAWSVEPMHNTATQARHVRIAYAPEGTLDVSEVTNVAVITLDAWAEVVPDVRHTTTAAFGFNAPSARAPQAILLAVPPDVDKPLDTQTLAHIIDETRTLARARVAIPKDLSDYAGIAPTATWLPSAQPTGVRLDIIKET